MSLSYGREKFLVAVDSMATGPDRIQQRLVDAWVYSLHLIEPGRDLPQEFRADFAELHRQATARPIEFPGEGTIQATLRQMTDDEGMQMAQRIVSLAHELEDYEGSFL